MPRKVHGNQSLTVTEITVSSACKCLGVSTSGYYAWGKRQIYVNQKYTDLKAVYWQHHARLGAPSLVHDMHDLGYCMSERTVGRMLKKLSLRSKIARKYKHTTDSNHRLPTEPNLLDRQFTVTLPNKVWTTDITYIRTKEGWLYLCVMLDLFSRRIIGWQTSHHHIYTYTTTVYGSLMQQRQCLRTNTQAQQRTAPAFLHQAILSHLL